jgi:hypothetical protein
MSVEGAPSSGNMMYVRDSLERTEVYWECKELLRNKMHASEKRLDKGSIDKLVKSMDLRSRLKQKIFEIYYTNVCICNLSKRIIMYLRCRERSTVNH